MTKRIIRCCPPALLFVALLFAAGMVQAQGTHTTGLPTTKTCPATAPDPPGTCYNCTFILTNADDQHGVKNLSVTDTVPYPGGPTTAVACNQLGSPVTVLGAAGSGTESCDGFITVCPAFNCSGVNQFNTDRIVATGLDAALFPSQYENLPVDGAASNSTLVAPLVCDDLNICTTDSCSVETGCSNTAIVCTADTNTCTLDPACDPAVPGSELCPHPAGPASTPCGTDTDGNDCTAPGCNDTGTCVQNHLLDAVSTPCGTDTDANDCTAPGCTAAGECVQNHLLDAVSTPCGTDTDGLTCTIPGCVAGGICSQTHVSDCNGDEICRTPGFWGTHGGTEKEGHSTNITQALLDAYNNANDPDLTICGRVINNTDAGNVNSALEAICVSPKGDSRLQLARQLTAAALNCIMTNSGDGDVCTPLVGAVCDGVSVEDIFEGCNQACVLGNVSFDYDHDADPSTEPVSVSCISAIDCFNNGGVFDPSDGSCDEAIVESCHDALLDNGCFNFQPPGAAGSPRECNVARKNDITVPPPPLVNECVKEAACGAAALCTTTDSCEGACFFTAAGNTRCFTSEFGCDQPACVTDADCPLNFACSDTCCGLQCAPLCGTAFPLGGLPGIGSSSLQ